MTLISRNEAETGRGAEQDHDLHQRELVFNQRAYKVPQRTLDICQWEHQFDQQTLHQRSSCCLQVSVITFQQNIMAGNTIINVQGQSNIHPQEAVGDQ